MQNKNYISQTSLLVSVAMWLRSQIYEGSGINSVTFHIMPFRVVFFPSTFLPSHWLGYSADKGNTVGVKEQNNKRNLNLATLWSPGPIKSDFMTLLFQITTNSQLLE